MILSKSDLPNWFQYPKEFLVLIDQNLLDFDPWIIITNERLKITFEGLCERYPHRELIPFARLESSDDVACWEKGRGVVIIHDFEDRGFEGGEQAMSFWDWLRLALNDMIEYHSERISSAD